MKVTSQSKSQSQYAFQEFDLCPVLPFSHMIRICTNICYHTFKSFLDAIAPTPVSGWVSQWVIVSDLEIAIASPSFANCFGNFPKLFSRILKIRWIYNIYTELVCYVSAPNPVEEQSHCEALMCYLMSGAWLLAHFHGNLSPLLWFTALQ